MDSKVFPATPQQALAMLYVQLHATAEDTPEQLWAMYKQAYVQPLHQADCNVFVIHSFVPPFCSGVPVFD